LFAQHGTAVLRYLSHLTNDAAAAEDLGQEVYLRIVRGAEHYEPRNRERAWIFRIARNVFLDEYRRESRRRRAVSAQQPTAVAPVQMIRLELRSALDRLATQDRDAFLLCEVGGLTYDEVATMLTLTVPSVRSRIYRARLALRGMLLPAEGTASPQNEEPQL
jgi:RNA polymerase sigma-70 factor (ECF subfamily)